jgi:hypothetical protein
MDELGYFGEWSRNALIEKTHAEFETELIRRPTCPARVRSRRVSL